MDHRFLFFHMCSVKGVLMHLNGFRDNTGVKGKEKQREKKSWAQDVILKRGKAKEDMYWADGSVFSGLQEPAEKRLLHRGEKADMERKVGGSDQERKVVGKLLHMERV